MLALALLLAVASPAPACHAVDRPWVGTLCTPAAAAGKHPAMILLGGSEGGDSMARYAPLFAQRGYVAASVAYFGKPSLPQYLVDVPVETVGRALRALERRGDVDAARIGILGVSKGGELALLAASIYPQFKAVVGVVPSPVAFMGLGKNGVPTGCSWSFHNRPLPCVPPDRKADEKIGMAFYQGTPVSLRTLYDASLDANPQVTAKALFPIERIRGALLCLSAGDDQIWDSKGHCDMAIAHMTEFHHPYDDRSVNYPDAGHLFLFATHGPASAITELPFGPVTMRFGGTKAANVNAARAAWQEIFAFLDATVRA